MKIRDITGWMKFASPKNHINNEFWILLEENHFIYSRSWLLSDVGIWKEEKKLILWNIRKTLPKERLELWIQREMHKKTYSTSMLWKYLLAWDYVWVKVTSKLHRYVVRSCRPLLYLQWIKNTPNIIAQSLTLYRDMNFSEENRKTVKVLWTIYSFVENFPEFSIGEEWKAALIRELNTHQCVGILHLKHDRVHLKSGQILELETFQLKQSDDDEEETGKMENCTNFISFSLTTRKRVNYFAYIQSREFCDRCWVKSYYSLLC